MRNHTATAKALQAACALAIALLIIGTGVNPTRAGRRNIFIPKTPVEPNHTSKGTQILVVENDESCGAYDQAAQDTWDTYAVCMAAVGMVATVIEFACPPATPAIQTRRMWSCPQMLLRFQIQNDRR